MWSTENDLWLFFLGFVNELQDNLTAVPQAYTHTLLTVAIPYAYAHTHTQNHYGM